MNTPPSRRPIAEDWVLRSLSDLLNLGWPAVACLACAAGLHAAYWLGLEAAWWAAPFALLAAVFWSVVGGGLIIYHYPFAGQWQPLVDALDALGGIRLSPAGVARHWGVLAASVLVAAIVLAIPWWPATFLWVLLLAAVCLGPRRAVLLATLTAALLLGSGLSVVALVRWSEAPCFWIDRTCGILVAAALLACLATFAPYGLRRSAVPPVSGVARLWRGWDLGRKRGSYLAVASFATAALALLLATGSDALAVLGAAVVWPGLLLAGLYLAFRLRLSNAYNNLRSENLSVGALHDHPEDDIRESDGYYRVCYPVYRHALPGLSGETGYLARFEYSDQLAGECAGFRHTCLFSNPLVATPDEVARRLAGAARAAIPDLSKLGVKELEQYRRPFFEGPGNIFRLRPRVPYWIAKMPWDHPYLLLVPIEWNGQFVYPAACGLFDKDALPCVVKKASVSIKLRPEVVAAIDRLSALTALPVSPDEETGRAIHLCQELVWNANRILPAVYERLFVALVGALRNVEVGLPLVESDLSAGNGRFTGLGELGGPLDTTRDRQGKRRFCELLNGLLRANSPAVAPADWCGDLPTPLPELVTVTVGDIEVESYLKEQLRQEVIRNRTQQRNVSVHLLKEVARLFAELQLFVHSLRGSDRPDDIDLRRRMNESRFELLAAADAAHAILRKKIAGGASSVRTILHDAEKKLTEGRARFTQGLEKEFQEVLHQFDEILRNLLELFKRGECP
jgi:hypothetical protein